MRTVLRASLRVHSRRHLSAALAVVIGVGFVVVTGLLSSAAREGLMADVGEPYAGSEVVAWQLSGEQADRLVRSAPARGAQVSVVGWTTQPVSAGGRVLSDSVDVGVVSTENPWQTLLKGRFPQRRGEVAADVNAAKSEHVAIGDRLRVGTGRQAVEVTVVGLLDTPSASLATPLWMTWPDARGWAASYNVRSVGWSGPGTEAEQSRTIRQLVGPVRVDARERFVQDRQTELARGVDYLATAVLGFVAVAIFVAVLVIANTFSILFAQRQRDFALLRCVGATPRQVVRSVRVEALVLGLVASSVGVVAGLLGGYGLVALISALWPSVSLVATAPPAAWVVGGFGIGLVVTLLASWLPTRRLVRVSPLAALRPEPVSVGSRSGLLRLLAGSVTLVVGVAGLVWCLVAGSTVLMLLAGGVTFLGVLLLGPGLVPALVRGLGAGLGRPLGSTGRLATANAVRNPRRTAATTASLLVGVTLTTAVLTGLASSRTAIDDDMDLSHPLDVAVTAPRGDLPADVGSRAHDIDGVQDALVLDGLTATVVSASGRHRVPLVGVPSGAELDPVVHGAASPVAHEGLLALPLPTYGWAMPGEIVTVRAGGGSVRLKVLVVNDGWGTGAYVSQQVLAGLGGRPAPTALWVRAERGTDAEDLAGDLDALTAGGTGTDPQVMSGLAERSWVDQQLAVLTGAVVGLLGIGVVIALIGIANTLGLSVVERAREHALLRAMGLTRRQLRAMLGVEAVLLSLVATLLGTALGVAFAWVGVEVMVRDLVADTRFVLPLGSLATVAAVAAVAGLLAAVLPARRAARVAPAAGLAVE